MTEPTPGLHARARSRDTYTELETTRIDLS